jgi:hypothetical protein
MTRTRACSTDSRGLHGAGGRRRPRRRHVRAPLRRALRPASPCQSRPDSAPSSKSVAKSVANRLAALDIYSTAMFGCARGNPFVTGVLTSCHDDLKSFLATSTSKCSWAQTGQASGLLKFARARPCPTSTSRPRLLTPRAPIHTQSAHTHLPVARSRARGHCRENRISSRHGVADRRDPPSGLG